MNHPLTPDYCEELANIEASRLQRSVFDRWTSVCITAGLPLDEASTIASEAVADLRQVRVNKSMEIAA